MVPDRGIVRKIKDYDPYLYLKWNHEKEFFELWREMAWGHRLITPVTTSIYEDHGRLEFCPLDERLIWWIWSADSWKTSPKQHAYESDKRWKEFQRNQDKKRREMFTDHAKDVYAMMKAFYATKVAPKNGGPKFNHVPRSNWHRPDIQSKTSSRIFYRSNASAKRLNFQR